MDNKGFTLIEILLVVALIALVSSIGIPVSQHFNVGNDLIVARNTIVQTLRRAQLLSQAVDSDMGWGVHIENHNIVLFAGDNYSSRNIAFDEEFEISRSITFSGENEIIFNKFSGNPQTTEDIILTSNTNVSKIITINEKGTIEY